MNVEELVLQAFYCGGLECCLPEGRLNESASGSCNDSDDSEWCGIHDEVRAHILQSSYYLVFLIVCMYLGGE